MSLALIAAVAANGVIGKEGDLPWRLPDELKYFRKHTRGKAVIMGRRTWESLRGPLKKRLNIVLTSQRSYVAEGALVCHSLADAITRAEAHGDEEIMVIGGASLYREAFPHAARLYLTHVDANVDGDVHFPNFDSNAWQIENETCHVADEKHAHAFRMVIYRRCADALKDVSSETD